jgi:hypothetical protein
MSHSAIVCLPLATAPIANCQYLDRCNRALTSDGFASCRFNLAGPHTECYDADSGFYMNLVAISLREAAK